MADLVETKSKASLARDHQAERLAMTASLDRMRPLRLAREAQFDARASLAAIRRSKSRI